MDVNCLVVDDSRMSRMMLKKIILAHQPSWDVHEAEDGQQAINLAEAHAYQVIFLDYNMPNMNGGDAAAVLRPKFPDAKIALLTANIQESIQLLAAELKIDFIPKPITETKIAQYVQ